MKPCFHVGQRVVCVDASINPKHGGKVLGRGIIYVIRAIDQTPGRWEPPSWGVQLEGIAIPHPSGEFEWTMRANRFRPVVDRPTDIGVFKKMLAGEPASTPPQKRKKPARPVQLKLPL